jgi:hypothetical protein
MQMERDRFYVYVWLMPPLPSENCNPERICAMSGETSNSRAFEYNGVCLPLTRSSHQRLKMTACVQAKNSISEQSAGHRCASMGARAEGTFQHSCR